MKILHLFHNLMNLYGEYANVSALLRELEKSCEPELERLSVGDQIDFSDADFIYIGSGTEKSQKAALAALKPLSGELSAAMERGAVVLATGNSFEMFGRTITDRNGVEYEGLGFFDFTVRETDKRIVTDCVYELDSEEIVGFVNKSSEIFGIKEPFFTVKSGAGNSSAEPDREGIRVGNFHGTHLIGPMLIRNSAMAKRFADILIGR